MKLNEQFVSNLLWWMIERNNIHIKKETGQPPPWTEFPVMRDYFFTNPFRENDKTTQWFRQRVRDPLKDDPAVVMATFIFRRFNYIPTGQILHAEGLLKRWDSEVAKSLLDAEPKIFTGAFMISSPKGRPKLQEICRMIDEMWARRQAVVTQLEHAKTLERAWHLLQAEHHKGLLPYEVVTDLRHTYVLNQATDIDTWAYFGPGGQRGVARAIGETVDPGKARGHSMDQATCLRVGRMILPYVKEHFPFAEMRDVEHSLCEADKFVRICEGGRSKRRYPTDELQVKRRTQ